MNYQVVTKTVSAQTIAAVRRRVRIGEVGRAWKPALDLVWEFLRRHEGLRTEAITASFTTTLREAKQRWSLTSACRLFGPFRTPAK